MTTVRPRITQLVPSKLLLRWRSSHSEPTMSERTNLGTDLAKQIFGQIRTTTRGAVSWDLHLASKFSFRLTHHCTSVTANATTVRFAFQAFFFFRLTTFCQKLFSFSFLGIDADTPRRELFFPGREVVNEAK